MRIQWVAVLVLACPLAARGSGQFLVSNLGTLGGADTFPYAINNTGQVVGESDTADGSRRAFLFSNSSVIDLGTLGGKYSSAYAINDTGQIVGQSDAANGGQHAFLFQNGLMTILGSPNAYSIAYGINATGQAVGVIAAGDNLHAALFDQGTTTDLDSNSGRTWGFAQAINASGQVGGIGAVGEAPIRAAIFNQSQITYPSAPVPYSTIITAINNQGLAAGQSGGHAALFDGLGNVDDLDTLAQMPNFPYTSEALGINNQGEVVGWSDTLNQGIHAFLYRDGLMLDLNSLIDPGSGWSLTQATAINDVGQIAGYGSFQGQEAAFLLTPINAAPSVAAPEPATAATLLLAVPLLLRRHRRTT